MSFKNPNKLKKKNAVKSAIKNPKPGINKAAEKKPAPPKQESRISPGLAEVMGKMCRRLNMIIEAAIIKLFSPWVHSLKEKRMVVKSLIAKTQNKFNVSIAEVDEQDTHQTIVLGLACVAGTVALADSMIESILLYIENNTDAEIMNIQREIR